jgi:hypothetical protein
MDINSMLDTEQDYQRRLKDKKIIPIVNLFFVDSTRANNAGNFCMIFDRNDPKGVNLSLLFSSRGYTFHTQNDMVGIRIQSGRNMVKDRANPALDKVKLSTLNATLLVAESSGMVILSTGQPITRHTGPYKTNLLINKSL